MAAGRRGRARTRGHGGHGGPREGCLRGNRRPCAGWANRRAPAAAGHAQHHSRGCSARQAGCQAMHSRGSAAAAEARQPGHASHAARPRPRRVPPRPTFSRKSAAVRTRSWRGREGQAPGVPRVCVVTVRVCAFSVFRTLSSPSPVTSEKRAFVCLPATPQPAEPMGDRSASGSLRAG